MKKTFLVIACLVACSLAAQETRKSTEFGLNLGYDFGLKSGMGGMFSLQPEFGKHFNEQFYLGIGTGVSADDGFNAFAIPAFLRAEVDFPGRRITPYISLQGGYDFSVSGEGSSFARVSPSVGIKVPMGRNLDFNLGFGYTRTIVDGGGGDFLGVKTGFYFNTAGNGFRRAMSQFFKSIEYSAEIETMLPVTEEDNSDFPYKDKYTSMAVRFSALAPMPLKNLYVGLNVGVGYYKDKYEAWNKNKEDKIDDDTYKYTFGYTTARVKYKAKQLKIADRIYPFVQVDAGAIIGGSDFTQFIFSPSAGLSYMVGEKHSIDLSAGYTQFVEKGTMRIAVGYTF